MTPRRRKQRSKVARRRASRKASRKQKIKNLRPKKRGSKVPADRRRKTKKRPVPPEPRKRSKRRRSTGAGDRKSRKNRAPRRKSRVKRPAKSEINRRESFGPATALRAEQIYDGPKQWQEYDPARVVDVGTLIVSEVGEFIRTQSDPRLWEGRMLVEWIWSDYMTNSESPDKRGNWGSIRNTSTSYTLWPNIERQSADYWIDMAEGSRTRADGSVYRIMVLLVAVVARRRS